MSLTVKSFSPVYLSALFFLFLFSIWTDGALFLPFAAWYCIIIPVQAALSLNAGCSTLQSAEITRQSLHQCVGLASCCCREAAADLRSRCLNSPYHFPDDALGRINSGGGRMLFTCRFLLSHLRQTTPASPSPFSPNMVRMSARPRPCSLSGQRSASPDEMRL